RTARGERGRAGAGAVRTANDPRCPCPAAPCLILTSYSLSSPCRAVSRRSTLLTTTNLLCRRSWRTWSHFQQSRYQRRPTTLVACPDTASIVTVKILVKE